MIITGVSAEIFPVVIEKVPFTCPAATVTLAGTLATVGLLLVNATVAPPVGATAFNVTMAGTDAAAATDVVETVIAFTALAVVGVLLVGGVVGVVVVVVPPVPVVDVGVEVFVGMAGLAGDAEKDVGLLPVPHPANHAAANSTMASAARPEVFLPVRSTTFRTFVALVPDDLPIAAP